MRGGEIVTTARFHPSGRWITVELRVGSQGLSMVLDTGAPITSLSRAASDQPAGLGLLRFTSQPNFYFLTRTAIEGRPVPDLLVGVAARLDRLQIVGLLGLDFLSLFEDIHFNLPSMRPSPCAARAVDVELTVQSRLLAAKRIAIVGSPGAGKSTLAIQLGRLLELPVLHLDQLWWRPGWIEAGVEAFDAELERVVGTDAWIIDGNYSRTLDVRLARADAAVMLDFPRKLCIYRSLKRAILYRGVARPDVAPGCPEKVDLEFLRFIWGYPTRSRLRVLQKLRAFGETHTFGHIDGTRAVADLLASLASSRDARADAVNTR